MRVARAIAIAAAALLLGCSDPVPADKAAYVGEWRAPNMTLLITQNGRVEYERREGGGRTSVNAPLQRFEGDNFVVGVGPLGTTFVVSRPPYQDGNVWKMVVDGVELVKGGFKEDWKA
jgi:hypothetical protein